MSTGTQRLRANGYVSPVFVDASGWLGMASPRDQHFRVASALISDVLSRSITVLTTNWTVHEAMSMLKGRNGIGSAEKLWRLVNDSPSIDLVGVNDLIERRALDLFFGYRDKTWGVVDCASMVVMEDLGCRQAIAFDRHFVEASRQRGFEVLG